MTIYELRNWKSKFNFRARLKYTNLELNWFVAVGDRTKFLIDCFLETLKKQFLELNNFLDIAKQVLNILSGQERLGLQRL